MKYFILTLCPLLISCQPSIEQQAKRELAVAEKKQEIIAQKQADIDAIVTRERAAFDYLYKLETDLKASVEPSAADKLKALKACEARMFFEHVQTIACYMESYPSD